MFTLPLASFASHRYCYLQFQSLSAFYGIWSAKHFTLLTNPRFFFYETNDQNYYMCQALSVELIGFLALYRIHLVSLRRKCIEKLCRRLISFKPESGIP